MIFIHIERKLNEYKHHLGGGRSKSNENEDG